MSEIPGPVGADVLVVGGGPAGLSAALNLARARADVVLVDTGRPRNAATLRSHGFLTRDGVSPIELRKLARDELRAYDNVRVLDRSTVSQLAAAPDGGFIAALGGRAAAAAPWVQARSVVVATGLQETLPEVPDLRSFYGMSLFSCAACDGWELRDRAIVLIGETPDLATRARLLMRWTAHLTVCTNGADVVDDAEEAALRASGVRVERRRIDGLEGERGRIRRVIVEGGESFPVEGGFIRPVWNADLDFLADLRPRTDDDGHLVTDRSGRTSVDGLYAAGDTAAPGPQQLIVAAGQGARVAAALVHDTLGLRTSH
ncbi:pyridine nucleotide-disulfide oxidoreductase [Microbacterium sp. SUBG005]|nr:pyridine nucleotide-disulfide oxidoreductase [Microbacterium sp. SUBG005]